MIALLDRCRSLDIRLWVDGDRLEVDAPDGAIDDDLWAELAEHKAELLDALAADPFEHLTQCHRTTHGWAWSDPSAPELEAFDHAVPMSSLDDLIRDARSSTR